MGSNQGPVRLLWPPGRRPDGGPLRAAAERMSALADEWHGAAGFCVAVPSDALPPRGGLGPLGPVVTDAYDELAQHEADPAVDLRVCVAGAEQVPPPLVFRNIRGTEAVETAAIELLARTAGREQGEGVLLLAQRFIPARVTAVVRAPDPGTLRVTACWGLGEDLLAGEVSADTFLLRRSDLAVLVVERAVKPWRDIPADVGVTRSSTPYHLRNVLCLSGDQVWEIAKRGMRVMERFGRPIPVEFALTFLGPRLVGTGGNA
ncbi:hypothetical protein Sru01_59910 [Sphaerisporangium rufum]|uniref:Pyruvate phosphate dikinase AMP/ATP-binding domain-containing protein n=1 Tax=Sphaerisporangium rufum TaxID=1381558 RepID=A0A919R7F7_9ACTN|nr:PEP/pyruvate-binding domain-containing protein [Sphaerisporangium rufum]GII81009.1 hypothetical protein Sru01_59910 [Sphaerisporangium rufum]